MKQNLSPFQVDDAVHNVRPLVPMARPDWVFVRLPNNEALINPGSQTVCRFATAIQHDWKHDRSWGHVCHDCCACTAFRLEIVAHIPPPLGIPLWLAVLGCAKDGSSRCNGSRLKPVRLAISGFSDSDYLQMTARSDSHWLQMNLQS